MAVSNLNRLGTVLVGATLLALGAVEGCSSDNQAAPVLNAGGSAGKSSTDSAAGKLSAGGASNSDAGTTGANTNPGEGGSAGEGEGGAGGMTSVPGGETCTVGSFDNSTLTAIQENGGELPPLP
jgi:hypothetical protein